MGKEFKNGLVLGKFMPLQKGHIFLINTAAAACENLYVMMCSTSDQPISGELRDAWLKTMFWSRPNVHILWCQDPNPQYPEEAKSVESFYIDYWVPTVYRMIKELDVVFTSEYYGDEFARYLGIKHVMVDQPRGEYAISATAIRNNPLDNWEYIPEVVRQFYMKRVVIMGPESTGKSTLTENLAKHFNGEMITEYGRDYVAVTGTNDLTLLDFENITKQHYLNIFNSRTSKYLFVDTEAMTTKIFGEMYLGDCESALIEEIINFQRFHLYLVMDIDVPWVDDGTREFPHNRESHLKRIKAELESRGINYILISGNYKQRLEKAINAIKELI